MSSLLTHYNPAARWLLDGRLYNENPQPLARPDGEQPPVVEGAAGVVGRVYLRGERRADRRT